MREGLDLVPSQVDHFQELVFARQHLLPLVLHSHLCLGLRRGVKYFKQGESSLFADKIILQVYFLQNTRGQSEVKCEEVGSLAFQEVGGQVKSFQAVVLD